MKVFTAKSHESALANAIFIDPTTEQVVNTKS